MSDTIRLRYTGQHEQTFMEPGIGQVEPDGEFDVPPERLPGFIRRGDIEHVGECPQPPCRCGEEPAPGQEEPASVPARRGRRGTPSEPPGGDAVN